MSLVYGFLENFSRFDFLTPFNCIGCPVAALSTTLVFLTVPVAKVQDKEIHEEVRESNQEKFSRDPYTNGSSKNYNGYVF